MKILTMCILILTLASIIPIADTQVEEKEVILLTSELVNNREPMDDIATILKEMISDELLKKGRKVIFTDEITDKWVRAIIVNIYAINRKEGLYIINTYNRVHNEFLHPILQRDRQLNKHPIVFLTQPTTPLTYKFSLEDGVVGAGKVLKEIAADLVLAFLREPLPQSGLE